MPSLRDVCTQSPVVVLDAASALVQVGLLHADGPSQWQSSAQESGVAVFECFERLRVAPQDVESWIFCVGPGSILGIRTVAMALRAWGTFWKRPVFGYASLALVVHALGHHNVGAIADARRETWHHFTIGRGLQRLSTNDLTGELVMPEGFRHWSPLPSRVKRAPYSLADLLPRVWAVDLLHAIEAPDAFLHEEPSYATWTPQIHRAPVP